ncbi:hypothetical protein [Marinicella sp. W31]|uniref:hypothetical protein n=1 Tax=Marinicella sp. W31 TaxID=3023713 RepID=UPI0037576F07
MSDKKTTDSVDQIRDILFGEQVKLFEKKINELQKTLSKHVGSLEKKITEASDQSKKNYELLQKQHSSDSDHLIQENRSAIENLQTNLSNQIIETEASVLNELEKKIAELADKATHRQELSQLLKKMSEQLKD